MTDSIRLMTKVPKELPTFGLIEDFVAFHSGGQTSGFEFDQLAFYGMAYFYNVRATGGGDEYTESTFMVIKHFIACGILVVFFYAGDVAQAKLVVIMSLDQHFSNIFYGFEFIVYCDSDTVVTIFIISCIGGFVLSVQCGENFGRFNTEVCHTVLQQGDVDTFGTFAVEFHTVHAFQFVHFPFHQFGIVGQFTVGQSVACQGIEHTIYVSEIILDYRGGGSFGQQGVGVAYFAAQHVPALFHFVVRHGAQQFYLYQG